MHYFLLKFVFEYFLQCFYEGLALNNITLLHATGYELCI